MPEGSGTTPKQSNWLDTDRIPAEIKLMILENIRSPMDLSRLAKAYPEWVEKLWNRYPGTLFPRALENAFGNIDARLRRVVLGVYHIRRIRREYIRRSSVETQAQRDRLQADLRSILRGIAQHSNQLWRELEWNLETVVYIGTVIHDVNFLTYRYSNDAWRRIHKIADQKHNASKQPTSPPGIKLSHMEKYRFDRGFLKVEIYLLTKFWTNRQGQRHTLDMGQDINPFLSHASNVGRRGESDSCLRFMFHALRGFLKKMAKGLGAPELPARDDLQWVPAESEPRDYLYPDDGTITPQGRPELDFARRTVSEEQRFLLWLCEFGIEIVRRAHRTDDDWRRDQLLLNFGRRRIWDTVELRHRVSRYDVYPRRPDSATTPLPGGRGLLDPHRNRHPVKSLYGGGVAHGYTETSSPWACAAAFLDWEPDHQYSRLHYVREGLFLDSLGHWSMCCDTDKENVHRMPLRHKASGMIPCGHQYMFDLEEYRFQRLYSIAPRSFTG